MNLTNLLNIKLHKKSGIFAYSDPDLLCDIITASNSASDFLHRSRYQLPVDELIEQLMTNKLNPKHYPIYTAEQEVYDQLTTVLRELGYDPKRVLHYVPISEHYHKSTDIANDVHEQDYMPIDYSKLSPKVPYSPGAFIFVPRHK